MPGCFSLVPPRRARTAFTYLIGPVMLLLACQDTPRTPDPSWEGTGARLDGDRRPTSPPRAERGVMRGARAPRGAAVETPLRLIVKVRPAIDQKLARAARPATGAIDVAAARATDAAVDAFLGRHGVQAAAPLHRARSRVKGLLGVTEAQLANRTRQRFAARAARAPLGARLPDLGGTYVFEAEPSGGIDAEKILAALRADPDVVWANVEKTVQATLVPNDPRFSELWAMPKINVPTAWDSTKGNGVVVAVVDSGVDYNHSDINDNMWSNAGEVPGNGMDDDGNGLVDDVRGWDFIGQSASTPAQDNDPFDGSGHGTHVAGTVAAEGNNGVGVIGVAWQAEVMALKGLDDNGNGTESTVASGIVYAADEGADVINASWGGRGTSQIVGDAIAYAHGLGVVFVASAGNSNEDATFHYPANHPLAITVAATDINDNKASFSNFGNRIDVAAPGVNILSLAAATDGYRSEQGTSMAAPHVSGLAALVLSAHPGFSNEQVRQAIRATAVDLGQMGKDASFGYGRINAAPAVALEAPLEAKFYLPVDGVQVRMPTTLIGSARGAGFVRAILERGAGAFPTTFTTLSETATPINNASLGVFDPSTLPDGIYTVRLRAIDSMDRTFSDQIQIEVAYLELTSPAPAPVPSLTTVAKPGIPFAVTGRATGPSFQSYRVEWAPGRNATTGFSAAGVVLTGGGTSPVVNGVLAQWTLTTAVAGEYTVRLTVVNAGFSSQRSSTIYFEPDLATAAWPRYMGPISSGQSAVPARAADGSTRLIACGWISTAGTPCHSISGDGTLADDFMLDRGAQFQPSAGNVDGLPGDEVVIADRRKLRIFTPDLTLIRDIVTQRQEAFNYDRATLADLDGDGVMEIVSLARDTDASGDFFAPTGSLHVYRGNGQLYSTNFPRTITSPLQPAGFSLIDMVVVDFDGDGRKEILIAVSNRTATQYEIQAFRDTGTPHETWPTPVFPIQGQMFDLSAADLDHDGTPEILIAEVVPSGGQIRVLGNDGTTRPGWPVSGVFGFAIGDIDRDGQEEIVANGGAPGFTVLRPNGTVYGPVTWPVVAPNVGHPVIADVDNDGFPDIVIGNHRVIGGPGPAYIEVGQFAISRTGSIIKQWRLFGASGQQALVGQATIGEFTGDGKTDIVVQSPLVLGGGINGTLINGVITMLTTQAAFNPANADWPMHLADAQNSRVRSLGGGGIAPPPVHVSPIADAYVRDGASAANNFGTANTLAVRKTGTTGNNRISYLRFPLDGVTGNFKDVKLRLFGSRASTTTVTDAVFAVANNTWSETGITWNNKPVIGAKQGTGVAIAGTARYYDWNVTSYVNARKAAGASAISFAIQMEANDGQDTFNSREAAANKPELLVTIDQPPTVASPARANPVTVSGTTTALAVLGADDSGEATLTYTWSTTGTPPAPVTFSPNGSHAAKNSTATFTQAGTYNLRVQIRDVAGQTVTSSVTVTVVQTLTSIVVAPATATVLTGGTQQFTATARDQFATAMTNQPAFVWTVTGGGNINSAGLFTAGVMPGGPFTVTAAAGGKTGTASVTVTSGSALTLAPVADAYVRGGTSAAVKFGTATTLLVKKAAAANATAITYLRFPLASVPATVTSAKLRLFGSRPNATTMKDAVFAVNNITWNEANVTWNTRPPVGAKKSGSVTITPTAKYYEWDVTAYVQARKNAGATAVSLAVQMETATTGGFDTFNAREAINNKPQLVITGP